MGHVSGLKSFFLYLRLLLQSICIQTCADFHFLARCSFDGASGFEFHPVRDFFGWNCHGSSCQSASATRESLPKI